MIRADKKSITIGASILFSIVVFTHVVHAKTYRWIDKKGKTHYSSTIPATDSQYGHQELDEKNGMTLNQVESSEIRKQRQKEEQLENEKNQINKKILREELMIYMFSSKQELVTHFEERLEMMSVNIRLLQYHQKKLKNTISTTGKKIKVVTNEKLQAKLLASLQESQRSLIDHSRAIESNEAERLEVNEQMVRAIKTYEIKFGSSQLNVGSLIGSSVLNKFRGVSAPPPTLDPSSKTSGMCSCPCSASNTK
ncbi:MAG: DUF4124 domain-containing protein [Thiotrichaceae bacterium]